MSRKKKKHNRTLLLASANAPFPFVEAYKTLRTNLEFISGASDCKLIVVTSSVPMEGKSNVTANMAMTLVEGGKRALMVDCDLRKGSLTRYVGLSRNKKGLSNFISGQAELQECVYMGKTSGCALMPSGPLPPAPAELLMSEKAKKAFAELRKKFDYVIVDSPPASVVTDAAVLSRVADGVVLVVRPGVTTIQGAQLAKKIWILLARISLALL